jgi:hypothetical protein
MARGTALLLLAVALSAVFSVALSRERFSLEEGDAGLPGGMGIEGVKAHLRE